MKTIKKFIKLKNGKYKLILENKEEITTYEDVILKHDLLISKKIDNGVKEEINKDNYEQDVYNSAIKYLKIRQRSIYEMTEYLSKKVYTREIVEKVINRLSKEGYLSEKNFVKAYIADKISFTNDGPLKIRQYLENSKIDSNLIEEELKVFDRSIISEKIKKYIDKMIKTNRNKSNYLLKQKILFNLINLGYLKEDILLFLDKVDSNSDEDRYKKEYQKLYQKLSKKYSGKELDYKIRQKLYQKGFIEK
jgi:regulatory protein